MTTTQPAGTFGHELVLHDGPAQLVDLMVPFVRDGAAAGDQVVVLGEPDFVGALLATAADVPTLRALAEPEGDRYPARDLHRFEQLLASLSPTTSGVRVVNQMPTMTAARWPEWRRYEAAVNVVLAPYRAWGICGYDTRELTAGMVSDLRASHPYVRTSDERYRSADFDDLDTRTRDFLDVPPHPLASTEPTLEMPGVTAAEARRAVREVTDQAALSPTARESLILATSEAVDNALTHGRSPMVLRVWVSAAGRVTVAVSDAGRGPHPLVGMLPASPQERAGAGMWLVHLLLPDVHHRTSSAGYTVTFAADRTTALPVVAR